MKMTLNHLFVLAVLGCLYSPVYAGYVDAEPTTQKSEIYVALFAYILEDAKGSFPHLYISEEPARKGRVLSPVGDYTPEEQLKGHVPAMRDSLLRKFLRALDNEERINVGEIAPMLAAPVTVVSSREANRSESWHAFVERFPDAKGLIQVSHISIDDDNQTALVYMDVWCGALCGSGSLFVVANLKHGWRVVGEKRIWVS